MLTLEQVEEKAKEIDDRHEKEAYDLAEALHPQIVAVCKRSKTTFSSGNGSFSFHRLNGEPIMDWDEDYYKVEPMMEKLNVSIGGNFEIGHYARDAK